MGPGLIIQALLLAVSLWIVIKMADRFPSDLASLRSRYRDFKTRHDPAVLERMLTQERRKNYQETCMLEFRAELISCALLWGVTVLAVFYALSTILRLILRIVSVFSRG